MMYGHQGKAGRWQGTDTFSNEPIKELINVTFSAFIPPTVEELQELTKADQPWAEDHFLERLSGPKNPGETYKYWPHNNFKEDDDEFLRHDGKFSHTYMERFWPNYHGNHYLAGDFNIFVNILRKSPGTRQGYLPIFGHEDLTAAIQGDRIPCTLGYFFIFRGGYLHLTYFIRSCDVYRHFKNDIYLTCRLAQSIREKVPEYKAAKLGMLNMWIGSFHMFMNDTIKVKKWLKDY